MVRETLVAETRYAIRNYAFKQLTDVMWVGNETGTLSVSWAQFERLANKPYDVVAGNPGVAEDLVVVFFDGSWLEREFHFLEEWWRYIKPPVRSPNTERFSNVFVTPGVEFPSLKMINGVEDKEEEYEPEPYR